MEIMDLVVGLFKMSQMEEDMDLIVKCTILSIILIMNVSVLRCVHEIRSSIDGNGDGKISKREFVNNAMASKFIRNMLNDSTSATGL